MRVDVMQHYRFTQPLSQAGYYETRHHQQLMTAIKSAILAGRLIALCGVIGSGKTVTLRRLHQQLKDENRVLVSTSLAVEKQRITLGTLMTALCSDLSTEKQVRIPTQGEKRERDVRALVKKGKCPVALFVDEAHDLNRYTLTGLKRLMEVVEDGDGRLSIVLAGHPKLRNDVYRPRAKAAGNSNSPRLRLPRQFSTLRNGRRRETGLKGPRSAPTHYIRGERQQTPWKKSPRPDLARGRVLG